MRANDRSKETVLWSIIAFYLFACHIWTIGRATLIEPEPSAFPIELQNRLASLDGEIACDFNRQNTCGFKASPSGSWSFYQSRFELFEQLKKAAKAAENALLNSSLDANAENQSDVGLQEPGFSSVVLPEKNYFPCSISPDRSQYVNARLNSSQFSLVSLKWLVSWPRFAPFPVPATADTAWTKVEQRSTKQQTTPGPSIFTSLSSLLACMHLNVRFPRNLISRVELSFTSNQTLRTYVNAVSPGAYRMSNLHIDWSLFTGSDSIPPDVWIEVTVPIDVQSSLESSATYYSRVNTSIESPPIVFDSNAITWIAYVVPTVLHIHATPGVCLDNFLVRPFVKWSADPQLSTCLRSLNWRDPRTGKNRMLLIDALGFAVGPTDASSPSPTMVAKSDGPFLRLYGNRSDQFDQLGWIRFTGSFVLAVSITLLFLTFVLTVSFSIIMAYKSHRTSKPPGLPRNRNLSDNLLTESVSPAKYAYAGLPSIDPEPSSTPCGESLFLNGTDTYRSGGDTRTELLRFFHEQSYRQLKLRHQYLYVQSGAERWWAYLHKPLQDAGTDMTNTSAVQLMRNWYFYRRKGNRARARAGQLFNPNGHSLSQNCLPAPVLELQRPEPNSCDLVSRPVHRRNSTTAISSHPWRQSLVLGVDANHQLITVPASYQSESAPSTSQRPPHTVVGSQLDIIPETPSRHSQALSEAEATRLELAESVRRLDEQFACNLTSEQVECRTPSTIARSQLSTEEEFHSSPEPDSFIGRNP
ncbi:hypothetical protein PHET_06120 [Paragonimus heterotremus]|uniref:Uncharacterized protein n=1 Tax=Paragonimus heterotremus TaxID=100268 RepID=A0A8J4SXA0_9TREM|nr:hypothetical protein PHET_06120 [Paragonimus heterotremus]